MRNIIKLKKKKKITVLNINKILGNRKILRNFSSLESQRKFKKISCKFYEEFFKNVEKFWKNFVELWGKFFKNYKKYNQIKKKKKINVLSINKILGNRTILRNFSSLES